MRFITRLLLFSNVVALIIADIYLWIYGAMIGVLGIIGIVGFLVAYSCYIGMNVALRDFCTTPMFDVFFKRIIYANVWAIITFCIVLALAETYGNETAIEFHNVLRQSLEKRE